MNTIVLKFGGTSVADNEKINLVANKIATLYDEGYNSRQKNRSIIT